MNVMYTENELCEVLKICKVTLWQYRKQGLPCIRLGSRIIRYDMQEVLNWINKQKYIVDGGEVA